MSKIVKWLKEELLNVLPAVIFFFLAFNVINLTTGLLVKEEGIKIATLPTIAIGSLVVGKVMLVIDSVPFINKFADKPLIFNSLWKTFVYSSAGFVFRFIEKLVPFISRYGKLGTAYRHFLNELDWPRFWAVQIWVVLLFFFFVLGREFIRLLGADKTRRIFLGW
jgi:hypothetical protein